MNYMATLKHIASKNSDYSAAEAYLVYQHDEFSGKVILDEQCRPMLRESYILDTLECGDFSFATACLLANRKYGKNTRHTAKKSGSVQSEHNQRPMKTCERIAQENHSSASSVRRAEYYAHGVDVADELSPGFRDRFFREELHIPDYLLENLGKAKPEEQAEIFEEIKNYVPKPKKVKPNKVTVKQAEKAASSTIDENYDVPQKFLDLYYRLHNAESLMRKSWEITFDLNPKLLTHPEQVKVLRFALKPHLEFLKTLDEVLAESSSQSSKTA